MAVYADIDITNTGDIESLEEDLKIILSADTTIDTLAFNIGGVVFDVKVDDVRLRVI